MIESLSKTIYSFRNSFVKLLLSNLNIILSSHHLKQLTQYCLRHFEFLHLRNIFFHLSNLCGRNNCVHYLGLFLQVLKFLKQKILLVLGLGNNLKNHSKVFLDLKKCQKYYLTLTTHIVVGVNPHECYQILKTYLNLPKSTISFNQILSYPFIACASEDMLCRIFAPNSGLAKLIATKTITANKAIPANPNTICADPFLFLINIIFFDLFLFVPHNYPFLKCEKRASINNFLGCSKQ